MPGHIQIGFAALPITPEIVDTWNDVNDDAKKKDLKKNTEK